MTDAIATRQAGINALEAVAESESQSVARMLHAAIEKGVPIETMERLVDLHERVSKRAAEQEFAAAMATFQAECPAIPKTSTAKVLSQRTGSSHEYTYAELDQIAETVGPYLHKEGLSYGWDSEATATMITVTCTLRHRNGHSVSARFACPTEAVAAMSPQQKFAAALTYARRQSLIQVLGLTTTDPDTDATPAGEAISAERQATLEALISEVGADKAKLLKWLGFATVADIPTTEYGRAVAALEKMRAAK